MSSKGYELVQLAKSLVVDTSGTITDLNIDTTNIDNLVNINLAIAPEVLEIQVDAPDAGQATMWKWTWEQSTLPYARRTITNSNELNVPLYKEGTYVVNNFAAYDIHGSMTQTHSLYLKWVDGAGTDNLVSWATSAGPISDTHPDINSGNATDVQRITVNVPSTITPPTLTNPSVAYTVVNSGSGGYTFSGSAKGDNPNIGPFYRGGTYTINITATGHPFYFTTDNGTNFAAGTYFGEYTSGVTGSRNETGTITFTVPANAPDTLYYQCGNHSVMRGEITVKDLAVETNINGNYVVYFQHTQEGHKTAVELRPIPSLVNQMCLVYDNTSGKFVPQDLATYVENTPSFENKIREVAGTAELVVADGSAVIAKVNVYADSTYLPLTGNNAGDQAFATDTDILYIWDGSAWQQAGAANSDDLTEGSTNIFFTDARADARIAAATTTDLSEGTNLYYTDARADARAQLKVDALVDAAPGTLDTLNELAAALGDDPNFATTTANNIAEKLPLAGGTMTGDVAMGANDITSTGDITTTGNIQATDLIATGTVNLDRLALTSSQTTVSPLQLTASALNDNVGALRIDSVEPDIYLNDTNGGFATVTFANADIPRVAFGRDSGNDFYLTVRDPATNSGQWRNDTFVADSTTGNISLGYNLTVTGTVDGVDIAARDAILTSTTTTANAALPKAGGTMTGNITFGDNNKAIFGAGSDLQIFHTGTNSQIIDAGTGDLYIGADSQIGFLNAALTEWKIKADTDGAVKLYYNNSQRLATTSTGVDVTGSLSAESISVNTGTVSSSPSAHFRRNHGAQAYQQLSGLALYWNTSNGFQDNTIVYGASTNSSLKFTHADGTAFNDRLVINSSGNVGIGTNSPDAKLDVNGRIAARTGANGTYNTGILEITSSAANPQVKITTNIPYAGAGASTHAHTVKISGFAYGTAETCDIQVCWHVYLNQFWSRCVSSSGGFAPEVTLAVENNFVVIHLGNVGYWPKLYVESMYNAYGGPGQAQDWTWSDAAVSADANTPNQTVAYKTDLGGGNNIGTAGAVFNEDGNDQDFRVESNSNTHALFVDAGADMVCFGTSTNTGLAVQNSQTGVQITSSGRIFCSNADHHDFNRTSNGDIIRFRRNTTIIGGISSTTAGTTYTTTSDRRLKDNINTITNGKEKLLAMNPVTHTWKADPNGDAVHGFIAQEMQEVVPEAVSGETDGDDMMSMDYGRITPVIVAALQDALKEIEELKTRIDELENK